MPRTIVRVLALAIAMLSLAWPLLLAPVVRAEHDNT